MRKIIYIGFFALLSFAVAVSADSSSRGYIDLDRLFDDDAVATVDVNLSGWILGLAKAAANESGDEDLDFLKRLDSVQIRVFESTSISRKMRNNARNLVDRLSDNGWESMVTAKSDDGHVHVMVHGSEDWLDGITVVAIDEGETVLVNISGRLEPSDLAFLMDSDIGDDLDLDWDFDI